MALSVLVVLVTVLLLSVSEVISGCPSSSGMTLDVYNNNCIGFIGIYLMHDGNCYPNGSYFFDSHIKEIESNSLKVKESKSIICALSGTVNGGKWIGPNGNTITCPGSNGNLRCTKGSSPNSLKLFIPLHNQIVSSEDGWYKCCLQAGCSNSIFANIFSKCSHCTSRHCHLLLIYCRMGTD